MTKNEASKLLNDYVDWVEEDGSQDAPFFQSIDCDDVFKAMRMGAAALAALAKSEPTHID